MLTNKIIFKFFNCKVLNWDFNVVIYLNETN